jgi:hypothetical protein
MTIICTEDGNWLVVHPEVGTISASSRDEAMREIARRQAVKKRRKP